MNTLLICKMGSVYRTRARAASAVGEQGETEGVIHHLLKNKKIRLVYFGRYDGEVPEGLTVINPDVSGMDEWASSEEQKKRWSNDIAALEPYAPFIGFIQVAGYSPTMSLIDNPNGATVQLASIKYSAPQLNVLMHFKIQRCMINCDPRNYPKDQEMSLLGEVGDWVRPRALLDQCDAEYVTRIGGIRYCRISRYAGVELWAKLYPYKDVEKTRDCTIIAHAHIKDGVAATKSTGPGRELAWKHVLAPIDDLLDLSSRGLYIYGKGWQHYTGALPRNTYNGVIKPSQVEQVLAESKCGPIVAVMPRFYTGKIMVYLTQGCAPIFYGDGSEDHPHTYDPFARYLSLDSFCRIRKPGDLKIVVDMFCRNEQYRQQYIEELLSKTRPNWSLLDELVTDLIADRDLGTRYGGYVKL